MKYPARAAMIDVRSDSDSSPIPSLSFTGGVKHFDIGLNLSFVAV